MKTVLITGGTGGIGQEVARQLAQLTYRVLIVGRNAVTGETLRKEIGNSCTFIQCDLSSVKDTYRLVEKIKDSVSQIDIIVHAADVLLTKRVNTLEGNEVSFATNYLSRVIINEELSGLMTNRPNARIIHIAAPGFPGSLSAKNFPPDEKASGLSVHNIGQMANDYYALLKQSELSSKGIHINVLNPGIVNTNIRGNMKGHAFFGIAVSLMNVFVKGTSPADYGRGVVAIVLGQNEAANEGIFLGSQWQLLTPRPDRLDRNTQKLVWERTLTLIQRTT